MLETTRTTLRLLLSHHVISFATSLNVNILHVRKLIDISFLCPSNYIYNNLFFLENLSCVKITHATYIVLKLLSFQYQSEILNIHIKLAAFLAMSTIHVFLTSRFLLEHKKEGDLLEIGRLANNLTSIPTLWVRVIMRSWGVCHLDHERIP